MNFQRAFFDELEKIAAPSFMDRHGDDGFRIMRDRNGNPIGFIMSRQTKRGLEVITSMPPKRSRK